MQRPSPAFLTCPTCNELLDHVVLEWVKTSGTSDALVGDDGFIFDDQTTDDMAGADLTGNDYIKATCPNCGADLKLERGWRPYIRRRSNPSASALRPS